MTTKLESLQSWVDQVAAHTQPETVHWCTGTEQEYQESYHGQPEAEISHKVIELMVGFNTV